MGEQLLWHHDNLQGKASSPKVTTRNHEMLQINLFSFGLSLVDHFWRVLCRVSKSGETTHTRLTLTKRFTNLEVNHEMLRINLFFFQLSWPSSRPASWWGRPLASPSSPTTQTNMYSKLLGFQVSANIYPCSICINMFFATENAKSNEKRIFSTLHSAYLSISLLLTQSIWFAKLEKDMSHKGMRIQQC